MKEMKELNELNELNESNDGIEKDALELDAAPLSDAEIEAILFEDGESVPEKVARKISPSRKAFLLTVWGLAFSALLMPAYRLGMSSVFGSSAFAPITSLRLDVLLPALGIVLTLIGLSKLKSVNGAFKFSYFAGFVRAAVYVLTLVFTFSVLHEGEAGRGRAIILTAASVISMLTLVFGVYAGFRRVRSSIGFEPRSGEFAVFALWYLLLTAFAVENSQSIVLLLGMPVSFALILLALHLLTQSFDEAGYAVRAERTRFSAFSFSAAGALVLACTLLFTFSCLGKYRINETPLNVGATSSSEGSDGSSGSAFDAEKTRRELIALGVPEYVVNDLAPGELKSFASPLRANASSAVYNLTDPNAEGRYFVITGVPERNDVTFTLTPDAGGVIGSGANGDAWWLQTEIAGQIAGYIEADDGLSAQSGESVSIVLENNGSMRVTTAIVQSEAHEEMAPLKRYGFIHYFEFSPSVSFPGTEALRISPVSKDGPMSYMFEALSGGRLLYERGGEGYCASFNSLEAPSSGFPQAGISTVPEGPVIITAGESVYSTDGNIYASFSVPDGAQRVRGYIAYSVHEKMPLEQVYANAHFTLVHQKSAANVSGKTAYELLRSSIRTSSAFVWMDQTLLFDKMNMKLE